MEKVENTKWWDISIGSLFLVYMVLLAAIFIVQEKIKILERELRTSELSTSRKEPDRSISVKKLDTIYDDREQRMKNKILQEPDGHQAQKDLANLYYQQGKLSRAIKQHEKLLLTDQDAENYLALGKLYMAQKSGKEKAIEYFRKVIEINPHHPRRKFLDLLIEKLSSQQKGQKSGN